MWKQFCDNNREMELEKRTLIIVNSKYETNKQLL